MMRVVASIVLAVVLGAAPAMTETLPRDLHMALLESQEASSRGDYARARVPLLAYLKSRSDRPHGLIYFALGNTWYAQSKLPQALADYRQGARQLPDHLGLTRNLAVTAYQLELFDEAAVAFERAWHLSGAEARLLYLAAMARYQNRDIPTSRELLRELWIGRDTGPLPWLRLWAVTELEQGDIGPVRRKIRQMQQQQPQEAGLWLLDAQMALHAGEPEQATAAFEVLFQMQAPSTNERRMMASLYASIGLPRGASLWAEKTGEDGLAYLGWLRDGGESRKVIDLLRKKKQRSPEEERYLVELLFQQGDWADVWRVVQKFQPEVGSLWLMAAFSALELERLSDAFKALEKAENDPLTKEYSRNLQIVLRQLQEKG